MTEYDSIKAAEKIVIERDQLRAELAALKAQGVVMPEPDFWLDGGATPCYYAEPLRAVLNAAPAAPTADAGLVEALEHARLFIVNGIDLGFIQMPEAGTPDPAHETLPMIDAALAAHRAKGVA